MQMKDKFFGAQSYTLYKHIQTEPDFIDAMKRVGDMGYKYIQISSTGKDISAKTIYDVCTGNGLKIGLTHASDERMFENIDAVIAEHELFGCDGIGIGGMPMEYRNAEGYAKFLEKYNPVIEAIGKAGKYFCYHNHWFEFQHYGKKTGMDYLLENTNPDYFKLTLDTAWMHKGGVDVADFIEKHGDRIFAIHLKESTVVDNELTITELLDGNTNWDPIIKACDKWGIKWYFVEQDWNHINKDRFLSLEVSRLNWLGRYGDEFDG